MSLLVVTVLHGGGCTEAIVLERRLQRSGTYLKQLMSLVLWVHWMFGWPNVMFYVENTAEYACRPLYLRTRRYCKVEMVSHSGCYLGRLGQHQ